METKKIIGYILLTIGLLLIVWSIWQSYNILTGISSAPKVFKTSASVQTSQVGSFDIQKQVQDALNKIIPADSINSTLNFVTWVLLAFILIWGGAKISDIGIKLIKS